MSKYLYQISAVHFISYKLSSISRMIAQYLISLFHSRAFRHVMSLAWNFSLMFDLISNWKFGLNLKVALSHGREDYANLPRTPKELKLLQYISNTGIFSFSPNNLKEYVRKPQMLYHQSNRQNHVNQIFWQHRLCLLATYLLFLNICSKFFLIRFYMLIRFFCRTAFVCSRHICCF